MPAKDQSELVKQAMGVQPEEERIKVNVPNVKGLHTLPTSEIAEVLTMVLKSQANIVELKYRVGDSIEVVVRNPF